VSVDPRNKPWHPFAKPSKPLGSRVRRQGACQVAAYGQAVIRKPTKTREELTAHVLTLFRASPECSAVTGVVIASVLIPKPGYANWHAAFTMKGRENVPSAAWRIGSQVADEFDLG
jgi:hypothetical protein